MSDATQDLINKALLALNSSNFLEKIANEEFTNLDKLESMEWSPEVEDQINSTIKKIKTLINKSEIEYKNLEKVEKEIFDFVAKSKKLRKP
jgi:hypothetical protein